MVPIACLGLVLVLAACTSSGPRGGPAGEDPANGSTTSVGDSAGPGTEPTSAAQISIEPIGAVAAGTPFTVTLTLGTRNALGEARPRLAAAGIARVTRSPDVVWVDVGAGETESTEVEVVLDGYGEGELQAFVDVVESDPSVTYTERARRYILATPEEVLTGTSGPLALQLEHLDHQLAAGRVTPAQYEAAKDDLLAGRQPE